MKKSISHILGSYKVKKIKAWRDLMYGEGLHTDSKMVVIWIFKWWNGRESSQAFFFKI